MAKRIPQDRPVYRLAEPFYDPHDNLHPAEAIIIFDGTPNQSMVPLNDVATARYNAYMDDLDAGMKAFCAAQVPPQPFIPHARIYDEPEVDIVDVSRDAAPFQTKPTTMKLGNRRAKTGSAAEAI